MKVPEPSLVHPANERKIYRNRRNFCLWPIRHGFLAISSRPSVPGWSEQDAGTAVKNAQASEEEPGLFALVARLHSLLMKFAKIEHKIKSSISSAQYYCAENEAAVFVIYTKYLDFV